MSEIHASVEERRGRGEGVHAYVAVEGYGGGGAVPWSDGLMASSVLRRSSAGGEKSLNVSAIFRWYGRYGLSSVMSGSFAFAQYYSDGDPHSLKIFCNGLAGEKLGEDAGMQLVLQRSTTTPYSDASRRSSSGWYQSVTTRLERLRPGGVKKVAMSKLAILSMPVAVDERVGVLDVPMQHALFMAVAEPDEDLRPEALDLRLREVQPRRGGEVGEVVVHVLEDEVEG
ncbi:LOW QUALITY PROTEIN: uncharacterized protein LOC127768619 [Oryza glaberrima]|uniref:LOW QUALITY PROTEIN: uncharacterized protein LOC127768619 n=1 Tax=Oryza glaberrima TaxID=4538 RepID=UPI00224C2FC9|nr:LOW QUALITY PROTEIN: uncharacterized protein LOC127768619 [Oryza glaberrima]